MRVAFVTNFCPHYRVKPFETLAKYYDVDYYFFSAGNEWYWQHQHGVQAGAFSYEYLRGVQLGKTRITPSLPWKLWRGDYDVYVKCINGRFALPATYAMARLKRKPIILWTEVWSRIRTPAHRLLLPATRYIYQHVDALVVPGKHVRRHLMTEGVPGERIFVAPNVVDNSFYGRKVSKDEISLLRSKLGIAAGQKVVLYLGRLEEIKGLPYLLEAFASLRLDDAVLVLAGTGSELPKLQRLALDLGIADRVYFPGYISQDETVPFYAIAWAFVLSSITLPTGKELWGLVVNEAMNQGVPVIATDAVGAAAGGLVQDGVSGFLVPERDSVALGQALQCILNDELLRKQMGENARRIIAGWDNERMVLGFRQAIEAVARGGA